MKKKIIAILVMTLFIAAAVLPVAGSGEDDEWENNVSPVDNQQYVFWSYHPRYCNGLLGVFATYNCMKIYPCLYHGYVEKCKTYFSSIPRTHSGYPVNDIMFEFIWDYCCFNHNVWKIAAPSYSYPYWELENIVDWVHENEVDVLNLVSIGDPTGNISEVYLVVDGNVVLEEPPIIQDEYYIEEGYCEELPGYLIGTTPIVFNQQAGPGENPFETTPLTGVLYLDGNIDLMQEENHPPDRPTIDGPPSGDPGIEYEYVFNAVDPDSDDVKYHIDWGDDTSDDTGLNPSGTDVTVSHTWAASGKYTITAYAEDSTGLTGPTSTFQVTMPRVKTVPTLLQRILERFPNAFPILRQLLGL